MRGGKLKNTATFKVVDPESGGDARVITRVTVDTVSVALVIDNDGDLEVFLLSGSGVEAGFARY